MDGLQLASHQPVVLHRENLQALFDALIQRNYKIMGPTLRDGAIAYGELRSSAELPAGWTDEQEGGSYRLKERNDQALFGYAVGPHSWKQFLHPPVVQLWQADRKKGEVQITRQEPENSKLAFIGVRACELNAIAVQDRVLTGGRYMDPFYMSARQNTFIVAVNCGQAGGTCFCVSMNAGPKATAGFDLALTEVLEGSTHYFLVEAGTDLGSEVLAALPHRPAAEEERSAAEAVVARAAGQMGRQLDTTDIKGLLYRNYEHPRWDQVASRCLTCANCTMVCPTCFCTSVEDVTDLKGEHAERWRKWDSCFTIDFSYIHGGSVRTTPRARYRQWMTHKLATWIDQFGSSGCVGCGRCITWCPVGIDITEEVRAIRDTEPLTATKKGDGHGNA